MLMSQLPPFGNSYANLDVDTLASGISGIRIFAGGVQWYYYHSTWTAGLDYWTHPNSHKMPCSV